MEMSTKLKPCPFCGSEIVIGISANFYKLECPGCDGEFQWPKSVTGGFWNRRVTPEPQWHGPEEQPEPGRLVCFHMGCKVFATCFVLPGDEGPEEFEQWAYLSPLPEDSFEALWDSPINPVKHYDKLLDMDKLKIAIRKIWDAAQKAKDSK